MFEAHHICDFSTGLDDLSQADRRQPEAVLRVLQETGRFSVFEIDDLLAKTLDGLVKTGRIKQTGGQYPWATIEVAGV